MLTQRLSSSVEMRLHRTLRHVEHGGNVHDRHFSQVVRDEHGSPVQPGARARTVPGRRAALALASGDGADAMHARKSKLHKSAPSVSEVVRLIDGLWGEGAMREWR